MLIGQVLLGGITRLTGSGLSITKWDIITGIIPPLNDQQWQNTFDLYRQTPQFHKINSAFSLADFKFIYFWEFFHRFWARALGIIFAIPFIILIIRKKIYWNLISRLLLVVALSGLTASAGWIMVQSGLINRPWVNAYKLTLHFILAILTITVMVKIIADTYLYRNRINKNQNSFVSILLIITFIQLLFAGLMSGTKAGLFFPTWPSMNGDYIPEAILNTKNWISENFTNYDKNPFAPALIQFFHRTIAYILFILVYFYYFKYKNKFYIKANILLKMVFVLVNLQVFLGILTLLKSKGQIPVFLGVTHQLIGLLFYISLLLLYFSLRRRSKIMA